MANFAADCFPALSSKWVGLESVTNFSLDHLFDLAIWQPTFASTSSAWAFEVGSLGSPGWAGLEKVVLFVATLVDFGLRLSVPLDFSSLGLVVSIEVFNFF